MPVRARVCACVSNRHSVTLSVSALFPWIMLICSRWILSAPRFGNLWMLEMLTLQLTILFEFGKSFIILTHTLCTLKRACNLAEISVVITQRCQCWPGPGLRRCNEYDATVFWLPRITSATAVVNKHSCEKSLMKLLLRASPESARVLLCESVFSQHFAAWSLQQCLFTTRRFWILKSHAAIKLSPTKFRFAIVFAFFSVYQINRTIQILKKRLNDYLAVQCPHKMLSWLMHM